MERSIFDLSNEELEQMISEDTFPPGISLVGMEDRDDYKRLFRLRNNAKALASIILKERTHKGAVVEDTEIKKQRLSIRELELKVKEAKITHTTTSFKRVFEKLEELNFKLDVLLRKVEKEL